MTKIQSGYLKTKNGIQLMTTVPYPIGAIYLSVDSTNPSKLFGGTWKQIAQGRTLVGVDTSQTEFNTVKKTGGEKTHTLTISEMASHTHGSKSLTGSHYSYDYVGSRANGIISEAVANENGTGFGTGSNQTPWKQFSINATHEHNSVGGNQSHNNLQPYYTCYIWLRTA